MEVKWTVTMILLQKKNDVDLSDKIFNNCRKRLQKKAAEKGCRERINRCCSSRVTEKLLVHHELQRKLVDHRMRYHARNPRENEGI